MSNGNYQLIRTTLIPTTLERAWKFFSDPRNLTFLTPPEMDFAIRSKLAEGEFYEGMQIEYTVHPIAGIPVKWVSEIRSLEAGRLFVDEQLQAHMLYGCTAMSSRKWREEWRCGILWSTGSLLEFSADSCIVC